MDLEYVNFLSSKSKNRIKSLYIKSFPKEERYPFWVLSLCARGKNTEFYAIYENKELIGMEYILKYENTVYLFYLAINKRYRGRGYGSKILKDLIKRYEGKIVILCIERPDKDCENIKSKRKEFYIKNDFYSTNKIIEYNGVEFEVLCTNNDFIVKEEHLENLYKQMTAYILGGSLIDKIFNIHKLRFIE